MGLCGSRSATAVVGKTTSKGSLWRPISRGIGSISKLDGKLHDATAHLSGWSINSLISCCEIIWRSPVIPVQKRMKIQIQSFNWNVTDKHSPSHCHDHIIITIRFSAMTSQVNNKTTAVNPLSRLVLIKSPYLQLPHAVTLPYNYTPLPASMDAIVLPCSYYN